MNEKNVGAEGAVEVAPWHRGGLGQPPPEWWRAQQRRWCNRIWDVVERRQRLRKEPERI